MNNNDRIEIEITKVKFTNSKNIFYQNYRTFESSTKITAVFR